MVDVALFVVLLGLFVKHFICDFLLQTNPWIWKNKGVYGHPGGLAHASIHGAGTAIVVAACGLRWDLVALAVAIDVILHYHIDYITAVLSDLYNLDPSGRKYWISIGLDQLMHHMTYFLLVSIYIFW